MSVSGLKSNSNFKKWVSDSEHYFNKSVYLDMECLKQVDSQSKKISYAFHLGKGAAQGVGIWYTGKFLVKKAKDFLPGQLAAVVRIVIYFVSALLCLGYFFKGHDDAREAIGFEEWRRGLLDGAQKKQKEGVLAAFESDFVRKKIIRDYYSCDLGTNEEGKATVFRDPIELSQKEGREFKIYERSNVLKRLTKEGEFLEPGTNIVHKKRVIVDSKNIAHHVIIEMFAMKAHFIWKEVNKNYNIHSSNLIAKKIEVVIKQTLKISLKNVFQLLERSAFKCKQAKEDKKYSKELIERLKLVTDECGKVIDIFDQNGSDIGSNKLAVDSAIKKILDAVLPKDVKKSLSRIN